MTIPAADPCGRNFIGGIMKVSYEQIRDIARLARLELPQKEVPLLAAEFEELLGFFDCVSGVECGIFADECRNSVEMSSLREDEALASLKEEELPGGDRRRGGMYRVGRVVK